MDSDFLVCPGCGSEIFVFQMLERKVVFHVSTHYLALVISEGGSKDASLINSGAFHCGVCSWSGGIRELVVSHG